MFSTTLLRLVEAVSINGEESLHYNTLCHGAYDDKYKGKEICAHNIVRAFLEAKEFMETEFSSNQNNWQWGKVHFNEYSNQPWSSTPLKRIWHRESVVGGNVNTP
jgi:acyl-homoserine lactone acylase PvdQ